MREIEKYKVEANGIKTDVVILGEDDKGINYRLSVPKIPSATLAFLDSIKTELVMDIQLTNVEILDPKVIENLKKKFGIKAKSLIKEKLPDVEDKIVGFLIGVLLNEMLGLGNIEFLLNDLFLEEIVLLSSKEPIKVYHRKYGWLISNLSLKTEEEIINYSNIIARRVGRQITTLNPLLDAHLVTGDRANAVLYPISTKGNTITIRKFARDPWTVIDFIENKTGNSDIFALIWLAIQYELNILISGGTASGKTSLLNVCMPFIPPNHRIVSIEDTRELFLPEFLYWCPLTTRQPNPEGKGEVTELDLLINALRMRPDRIILGEMRKKEQAEVLFEAMHTGHSVYATVHADSVNETIQRLTNPPINVPYNLLNAVNLNVVMFRDRRKGIRRVYQIGEFIVDEEKVKGNILYRWKPENDEIVPHAESAELYEGLSRFTGMTKREIDNDLVLKKKVLNWILKNKIRGISQIGELMREYYLDESKIIKFAEKNVNIDKILKRG